MAEFDGLKRKVLDALPELFNGTSWAPPEGSIVTESVVIMLWMQPDGKNGTSVFPATNHWWSTSGLLRDAFRQHDDIRGNSSEPDEY